MDISRRTWRQRLSFGVLAIALVCSLSLYKSSFTANPSVAVQKHWKAIASSNPDLLVSSYSDQAILKRSYGVSDADKIYRGDSIYSAWREFFWDYKIKDFQVAKKQQRDRSIEAQITITAKSHQGEVVVLLISYQAQFDQTGKIIQEVWETNPELSV
jgi:hypothetical protein